MNIDDLFKEGLLKKARVDKNHIKGSLELADRFLERAKGNLGISYYDVAFTLAYNAMFHAARALLFSLGVKERSHFAMIYFLKEKFKDEKEIYDHLAVMDSYRMSRHGIQYNGELCDRTDAEEAIRDAEEFLNIIKSYLAKKMK